MTTFIEINADIFNADKIQALIRRNEKNRLGNDNGVYILEIHMEGGTGSVSKAYPSKKIRDEDFLKAKKQLEENGYIQKVDPNGGNREESR